MITIAPVFLEVLSSCSRSTSGTSSSLPCTEVRPPCRFSCAAAVRSRFCCAAFESTAPPVGRETATSLRMLVPIRMRSPSFSSARRTFSPFTNVPLVEPRSAMVIWSGARVILACLRETMSSISTMSRSVERPITSSPAAARGYSPPWYFPEMKRSAYARSLMVKLSAPACAPA